MVPPRIFKPGEEWILKIVRSCERRKAELVVPWKARLLLAVSQLSPALGDWIVGRMS